MGWCPEAQGIQREPKLTPTFLVAQAKQVEDLLLHIFLMNSDTATADFIAVENNIVRNGVDLAGSVSIRMSSGGAT